MICPQCQCENLPDAVFCDHCGARLAAVCSHCGAPNRGGATFCRICGQTVTETTTVTTARVPCVPPPDSYVPRHLAEKILASRQHLEGERKQVTVLFADIRGSTRLLEGLDPEEAQKLIDPILHIMMDAVHRYEGTVNQVLGDGIMALFGAPLAHEDHALRACYAALAMQDEMRRHREKLSQPNELELQIGIGLNSGEVVVRSIDNDLNVDYSALGQTTNLAARMEELAATDAILITESTLREVEGFVQIKDLGGVYVKGISRAVNAYELTGATAARTRVQAGARRGLSPLVGRKKEIEIFRQFTEPVAAGHGQILSMVGEPGMGKSRLVYEFIHSHLPPNWLVLEAPSVSYGKATPYFPLLELLRRYFAITEGEATEGIQNKIVDHVLKLDEMLTGVVAPILALLGALPQSTKNHPIEWPVCIQKRLDIVAAIKRFNDTEPPEKRRETLESLKRILIRESQRQPLMLVFEDLHWIDSETQSFLEGLVDSLPKTRVLLLLNYRPGYSHNWSDKTYYTQIRVDPLPSTGAEELLQHLLGDNPALAPLKELLIKRTQGNPFFVEESVRSLVETGVLAGDKGAYRPGLKVDSNQIPTTVQNVVADRIDRLSTEEKHLLQTAAVIGESVSFHLLRAVSEMEQGELYQHLSRLQAAEFLYESTLFPELEYSFKHALTTEVAYGALLRERRTYLHARIVKALEEMTQNLPHDHLEKLAHHAFRGELWDKAVIYLRDAGARAVSLSSFRNAVFYFERALEALRYLPRSDENLRNAVDLQIDIRNALFILGDFEHGLKLLQEAKAGAEGLNDEGRLGTVFNLMTAHCNLAGNSEQAVTYATQALNHTKASEHLDLHIVAQYFLGVAYHNLGQYDQAVDVLEHALCLIGNRKYERFGTTGSVYVVCRVWLLRGLAQLGKFSEAAGYGEEAIQAAVEIAHPYSIVYAYYGVGVLYLIKGDFSRAIDVLERGLKICDSAEIPVQRPLIASCLGAAYGFVGRLNEALQLLESAVKNTASMKRMAGQAMRVAWLSGAYMLADRLDEAEAFTMRGLELAGESRDKGTRAWLLGILGDLNTRRNPSLTKDAEAYYGQALAVAQELAMRPLQAHCHLGLANVYGKMKSIEKGRSELRKAVELYRSMSMQFWLSKAEAALAELS